VLIQVLWDQRVIDGRPIRRMLGELESTLNCKIVAELQGRSTAVGPAGLGGGRSN
jgi:hypothetical protein